MKTKLYDNNYIETYGRPNCRICKKPAIGYALDPMPTNPYIGEVMGWYHVALCRKHLNENGSTQINL